MRSRVATAIEAVQALDIDDALDVLEDIAAELAALDHAYESTSSAAAYRRWQTANMDPRLDRQGEGGA